MDMMHKTGCMSLKDKRRQTLTLKAYSECCCLSPNALPSASIWPTTLEMTFLDFPLNCTVLSQASSVFALRDWGVEEEYENFIPHFGKDPAFTHTFLSLLSIWHPIPTASLPPAKPLLRHDRTGGGARRFRCGSWPVWEVLPVWTLALPDATSLLSLIRTLKSLQHNNNKLSSASTVVLRRRISVKVLIRMWIVHYWCVGTYYTQWLLSSSKTARHCGQFV